MSGKINENNITFITSAASEQDFLTDNLPTVVFAGKSNVGKSSVINRLANRKNLARVGGTPGKTIHINYFNADGKQLWADLPGYGYARVSRTEKERWALLLEAFFEYPDAIGLGIIIVDSRHEPTDDDRVMYDYFLRQNAPRVVVANKCDKLKKNELDEHEKQIRQKLRMPKTEKFLFFSAENGTGRDELMTIINCCKVEI